MESVCKDEEGKLNDVGCGTLVGKVKREWGEAEVQRRTMGSRGKGDRTVMGEGCGSG